MNEQLGLQEGREATVPTDYEQWLADVQAHFSHGLDGDQETDGYSLDWIHELYAAGWGVLSATMAIVESIELQPYKSIDVTLLEPHIELKRHHGRKPDEKGFKIDLYDGVTGEFVTVLDTDPNTGNEIQTTQDCLAAVARWIRRLEAYRLWVRHPGLKE